MQLFWCKKNVDQIKLMSVYLHKMWILAFKFQRDTITSDITSAIVLLTEIFKFVFLPLVPL